MISEELEVDTRGRRLVDLTESLLRFCSGRGSGLAHAFVPHATCALVLLETGAGSEQDLLARLEQLLPRDAPYQHRHGSPGHGADHLLPALLGCSVTVPVGNGIALLGTWQRLVLVDTNRENNLRRVRLSFLPG
ncbi:MAG: secondary thiamine-phosphate synthase enzyme YjbQ [Candidatus Dormibacteria bacterium]